MMSLPNQKYNIHFYLSHSCLFLILTLEIFLHVLVVGHIYPKFILKLFCCFCSWALKNRLDVLGSGPHGVECKAET